MDKIYFKSNIKHLVKIYGDTKENLAFSLGYNSGSAISNWFNKEDTFIPSNNIIEKICSRYSISKEHLLYEDLRMIKSPFLFDLPEDKIIEFASYLLPLIEPKEDDSYFFKKGYIIQRELYNQTNIGAEITQQYFEYMDLYQKAYENDNSYSALANMLSSLVLIRANITNEDKIIGMLKYRDKKISKKYFTQNYMLNSDHNIDFADDTSQHDFMNELDTSIMNIIYELKKQSDFFQFADYYLAIRYKLNIADSDLDKIKSELIAESLLLDLALLKNIYAINYLVYFDKISKKYLKISQPVKAK